MKNTNPTQRVVTGQRMRPPSAATWNALLDTLNPATGDGLGGRRPTSIDILVQNDTGADLAAFGVVLLGSPIIPVTSVETAFSFGPIISATAPIAGATNIAIVQEPIADGAIGRAVVYGVTACKFNVMNETDTYASATTSTTELTTAESGAIRILSKQAGTGSGKWGTALVGCLPDGITLQTLDVITKACVVTLSGGITRVTYQHEEWEVLGRRVSTYCTTDDDDCCPTVEVACCAESLPRCLKVTFANGTGFWSCLDGSSIYLVFDSVTEQWVCASTTVTACNSGADIRIYASAIVRCVADNTLDLRLYLNYDDNASEASDGTHPCYASGQLFFNCDDLPETWTGEVVTCNPEPDSNTIDFTLAAADCDEVPGDAGGGDPGDDGCCTDTADLTMWVNGTGDFEANYGDGLTLTYDPEGIVVELDATGGCESLVDRFQWMGTLSSASESPVFFFGCKDGVYYIGWKVGGFSGGFAAEGCFDYTSVPANQEGCINAAFGYVAVDTHSCEGSVFAELLLTGNGETACSGTIQFTVYR